MQHPTQSIAAIAAKPAILSAQAWHYEPATYPHPDTPAKQRQQSKPTTTTEPRKTC